jgi:hypothetical protein
MACKLCETGKMDAQTLYSRSGRIMASAGFVFALFGITALAIDSWLLLATKSWVYIWFAYFAWLLFWNPSVKVSDEGVVVDNIFKTHKLNWSAITRIDTKYSLTLETKERTIQAFGAPAPSRYAGFMANKTEAEHLPESSFVGKGLVRPGDLTSSDSGVAAYIIRSHWEKLRDLNKLNETSSVKSNWVLWRIVVFLCLSSVAVASFIF